MTKVKSDAAATAIQYGFIPCADGTVTLSLMKGPAERLRLSIRIEDLAGLAAAALHSARVASELSGKPKGNSSKIEQDLSGPTPNQIGIALGPTPDQVALVAHFGAAVFALPFQKSDVTRLGHALLAAGASSTSSN